MNEIKKAREMRVRLASSVNFFISNSDALNEAGDCLEWEDFEKIPEWYMWNEDKIQHLVLVAGTVFLVPTIRLWIEATKISRVKNLIGGNVYEFIMQYTQIDNSPEMQIDMDNLHSVMMSAGASVLMSSQEARLRPWLISKLPEAKGKLNRKIANELMNHTLFVLSQTDTVVEKEQYKEKSESEGVEVS